MSEQKKVKASEKLSLLEKQSLTTARRVGEMELILYNVSRENEILKDALQLVHEKLDAVVSLSNEGKTLTDENINGQVVLIKEQDLKNKVDQMIEQGAIIEVDKVSDQSFIVSRELSKDGVVVNPRLQFMMSRLVPELQGKFLGKSKGELYVGDEDKLDIEIAEIYDFVEQKLDPSEDLPIEEGLSEEANSEEN